MKSILVVLTSAALIVSGLPASAQFASLLVENVSLRPTFGGAYVTARITAPAGRTVTLDQVYIPRKRVRVMRCAPTCQPVDRIPVPGMLSLGENTEYRVIVGGRQTTGSRHGVYFKFGSALRDTEATMLP